MENGMVVPQEIKNSIMLGPSNPTCGYCVSKSIERNICTPVFIAINICKSQKVKATRVHQITDR